MESALKETVNERLKRETAQRRSGTTRRNLLKGAGALLAAEVADQVLTGGRVTKALIAANKEPLKTFQTPYEVLVEKGIKPSRIQLGEIRVIKSVNGISLKAHSGPNTESDPTDWSQIQKWNGINIPNGEFVYKNALLVEGENTDPQGSKGEKGLWLVGNAGIVNLRAEEPRYISYSAQTAGLVIPVSGFFYKVVAFDEKGVTIDPGNAKISPQIPAKEIGIVIAS